MVRLVSSRSTAPHVSALSRRSSLVPLLLGAISSLLPQPGPLLAAPTPVERELVRSRTGLKYVDFKEGSGPTPRYGQIIRFHYVVSSANDASDKLLTLDSSYMRDAPYLTKHGNGFTCEGLEEALHTMRVGGRRRAIVPPNLGYTSDKGPFPPDNRGRTDLFAAVTSGKPLVFDIEVSARAGRRPGAEMARGPTHAPSPPSRTLTPRTTLPPSLRAPSCFR